MPRVSSELYEFGEFRLDVGERRLEHQAGRKSRSSLPEKAFQTLVHLVRNSGTLVPKEELLSAIWPDAIVEENNVGKAVHAIRQYLGEKSGEKVYIETVPKHGYRFVADVTRVDPLNSANGTSAMDDSRVAHSEAFRSPAYDLYLRGRVKAGSENRGDTEDAIKILEAAVAIDPDLAPVYAQLARAYNTLAFKFSSQTQAKLYHENAEVAILKALALDPNLAEAHFARGLILWTKRKGFPHEQAIQSYKRSLSLDPNSDETHHQLSMVYSHIGLIDEAHESVARALELNPDNTMARFRVGVYNAYQGRLDDAINVFKTIPRDVSPILVDRCMAEVFIQQGELEKAETIVEEYLASHPTDEGGSFTSVKALLLAKQGNPEGADEAIGRAVKIGTDFGHFHHTAHNIAAAYTAMDKLAEAVSWLQHAADDGFPNLTLFEVDRNLDPLRGYDGFVKLMSKLRPQFERFRDLARA